MRLKRTISTFTATIFFVLGTATVFADSQYVDKDKVYSSEGDKIIYISSDDFLYNFSGEVPGVTICGYIGDETKLVIPDEINGRAVAAIDENTLAGNEQISTLTIPAGITAIGAGSFNDCKNLESITFSSGAKILENVFCGCSKLKYVFFPYGISEINDSFKNCTSLNSVKFSRSVSKLGDGSFNGCISLNDIKWSTGLSYLGDVFDGCNALSTIHVPKGIVIIDSAFDNCIHAEILELPTSLLYINSGFNGCTSLRSVNIPEDLVYIGNAFNGCNSLKGISLSSKVELGEGAFADCPDVSIKQGISTSTKGAITIVSILLAVCIGYTIWKSIKKQDTEKITEK